MTVLAACGGAPDAARPEHPRPVPAAKEARSAAIQAFGEELHRAVGEGHPERVLFDDVAIRELLAPKAATRVAALRVGLGTRLSIREDAFASLRDSHYAGVCLQGSRLEPAGSPLGLEAPGWVFDRALVVGAQPGGRRVAAWVEGTFLYTNVGFGAIDLARVEEPRWEHSDLEIAPCDMEVGLHTPLPVVDVTE